MSKVRRAQDAGYRAAIVYDDRDGPLVEMDASSDDGVVIPSVFVSKATGESLISMPAGTVAKITSRILSPWPSFLVSFIVVICATAFVFAVYIVYTRRHRGMWQGGYTHGATSLLSSAQLGRMPTRQWTEEEPDPTATCCICLDEYSAGDTVLTLPCGHEFHKACITPWLTQRKRVCPLCKRDPIATERTPLLVSWSSGRSSAPTAAAAADDDDDEAARPLLLAAAADGNESSDSAWTGDSDASG